MWDLIIYGANVVWQHIETIKEILAIIAFLFVIVQWYSKKRTDKENKELNAEQVELIEENKRLNSKQLELAQKHEMRRKHKALLNRLSSGYYKKKIKKQRVLLFVDKFLEECDGCEHKTLEKYRDHDKARVGSPLYDGGGISFYRHAMNYECLNCGKIFRLESSWRGKEIESAIEKNRAVDDWIKKTSYADMCIPIGRIRI